MSDYKPTNNIIEITVKLVRVKSSTSIRQKLLTFKAFET
jgi:hypothetical protein